jgi:hypothetical protein
MSKLATQIVHWPGKDTAACDEHASKLKALGSMLVGFVSSTPVTEGMVCTNCENEDKKVK